MPSPTISFCDKYGDRSYNTETEDVATLAVNYSTDYLESFVLPTFSKERTYYPIITIKSIIGGQRAEHSTFIGQSNKNIFI